MDRNRKPKREGKAWEELQISDDFLFSKVMRDKDICISLLEKLLKVRIKDIIYLEEEKTIDIQWGAKSIRMDVYVEDEDRVFNLEMQTTDKKDLPHRSRYYQGMIDLNIIEKGELYKKLKDSYVIFICTFDPFGEGREQCSFENLCVEDKKLRLNDGTKKIFFNTTAYAKAEDEDIREFLKYVNGEKSDNPFVKHIDSKVKQVKTSKEWRREYMTLLMWEKEIMEESREAGREEGRKEGIKEGIREGRKEGIEEGIRKSVKMLKFLHTPGHIIVEQLMQEYALTKEKAEEYCRGNE